ncbi:hypothetical protein [Geomicrobium sediminis]|uniref:Uncharacterized protein n=1 Tax=Geomicrobium sediminis TaxID=1347788 RepID=A0ABS2PGW2_9BACL|nr:hypothetical protein [Geomicrobium sediminis]MBM7634063.1 hypothetical protein [Geomicrobium sediminis]
MSQYKLAFHEKIERFWEKYQVWICLIFALLSAVLYYFSLLQDIRGTLGDVITFSSIVIGINGVFLTLVITLKESIAFERLSFLMPKFQERLYKALRDLILYGLALVTLSVIISLLPSSPSRYLSAMGVSVWFFFFWKVSIGSFYTVKLVTDIVVKSMNTPVRKKRK